jgi:hypothetical protein
MPQEVTALFRLEIANERANLSAQTRDRSFSELPQQCFQGAEHHLDWVQVRRILRQITQLCAGSFDSLADSWNLVGRQIVRHNDIPAFECGEKTLFDVGPEYLSGHGTFNHQRRDHSFAAQRGHKGHGLPMPLRHSPDQANTARAAAIEPYHIGADRGLIDEYQMCRVKQPLLSYPASPCPRHVGALLFGRAQAFF